MRTIKTKTELKQTIQEYLETEYNVSEHTTITRLDEDDTPKYGSFTDELDNILEIYLDNSKYYIYINNVLQEEPINETKFQ